MIHQQREKLSENIAHHEHEAQHRDGEEHVDEQFAAEKSIN